MTEDEVLERTVPHTTYVQQAEIISEAEFYFLPREMSLENDDLEQWQRKHRLALSLAHILNIFIEPAGTNVYGYKALREAFVDLCDIFGIKEPEGDTIEERGFKNWAQFLDKVDEVNNGRWKRLDEV